MSQCHDICQWDGYRRGRQPAPVGTQCHDIYPDDGPDAKEESETKEASPKPSQPMATDRDVKAA